MDPGFEQFAEEHTIRLLRTAYLLTGSQQDAEDLAQDTLVKVQQRWRQVVKSRNRVAYVHRMLINHFLSGKRKRSGRIEELTGDELNDEQPDFADALAERDSLAQALMMLPPRERTAVVLKYYLDLDNHEVAVAMGVADSTSRSTLTRGIQALRAGLQTTTDPAPHRSE